MIDGVHNMVNASDFIWHLGGGDTIKIMKFGEN